MSRILILCKLLLLSYADNSQASALQQVPSITAKHDRNIVICGPCTQSSTSSSPAAAAGTPGWPPTTPLPAGSALQASHHGQQPAAGRPQQSTPSLKTRTHRPAPSIDAVQRHRSQQPSATMGNCIVSRALSAGPLSHQSTTPGHILFTRCGYAESVSTEAVPINETAKLPQSVATCVQPVPCAGLPGTHPPALRPAPPHAQGHQLQARCVPGSGRRPGQPRAVPPLWRLHAPAPEAARELISISGREGADQGCGSGGGCGRGLGMPGCKNLPQAPGLCRGR